MMYGASSHIGQHLFIGFGGSELTGHTRRLLNSVQPGGVVLFARNICTAAQLRELGRALRTELSCRPLVALDQEHGLVNRLRNIIGEMPTIAELKRSGHVEHAEDFGRTTGRWLHQFHIDMNFAPVLDIESFGAATDNALRGRCWGRTADEVILWAGAFLEGLEREGVAGCPKHFPGLGAAQSDSHEHLPTIQRSRQQLVREDIRPYSTLLRRLSALMVGHGHYPAFDGDNPRPATLSRAIMTGLLRQQMGYTGLILTDDMEMGAVSKHCRFEEAIVEAVRAGADMTLVCHSAEKVLAAHEALAKAAESGALSGRRLAESRQRIRRFREEWIAHKS